MQGIHTEVARHGRAAQTVSYGLRLLRSLTSINACRVDVGRVLCACAACHRVESGKIRVQMRHNMLDQGENSSKYPRNACMHPLSHYVPFQPRLVLLVSPSCKAWRQNLRDSMKLTDPHLCTKSI